MKYIESKETLDLLASRVDSVKCVIDVILKEFVPKGRFTAEEVYEGTDGCTPRDLDMYLALAILEKRGDISPLFEDDGLVPHDKMIYKAAPLPL